MARKALSLPAAVLLSVLVGLIAPDALATEQGARYVDDDGMAGPQRGCDGGRATFRAVQEAVNASKDGDVILVCPGVYTEAITINVDVKIRAATGTRPTLRAPRGAGTLVFVNGRSVTLNGLRLRPHGGSGTCPPLTLLYARLDAEVVVRDVRFIATRPFGSSCGGYDRAIGVDAWNDEEFLSLRASDSVFRDFNRYAIGGLIDGGSGADGLLVVKRSRFVIRHKVIGKRTGGDVLLTGPMAINLAGGAPAEVTDSLIISERDDTRIHGIAASGSFERNTIVNAGHGIIGGGSFVDNVLLGATRASVGDGIVVQDDGWGYPALVTGNVVSGFAGRGILVREQPFVFDPYQIVSNDFRGNRGTDCVDRSEGTGSVGTNHVWENNLGFESNPAGICRRAL